MSRLRFLQVFEGFLVLALCVGLFSLKRAPLLPQIIGIFINLLWQYVTILAIRKQKRNEQLPVPEQTLVINQQRAILKATCIGAASLFIVLMVNVGMLVSHSYSIRTFTLVTLVAAVLTFAFLTFRFTKLRKLGGVQ